MSRFEFQPTPMAGLTLVTRQRLDDGRGFLARLFCAEAFRSIGVEKSIQQINHTLTRRRGTVRGMHYQRPPSAEIKLVSCLRGEVFDVAVDLRRNSPTFLRWHGEILSADNQRSFLIPEGFAHGFQALTDDCELIYLHTAAYDPGTEAALRATDPALAIDWPLAVCGLSERDSRHPLLAGDGNQVFEGIEL